MIRVLRIFAVLAGLAALAACSLTSVAYNNVVPLASWYIDDYVELNDAQAERMRESLGRLHTWHRASELPEYSRVLEDAARKIDKPVAADDVQRLYDDGRRFMQRLGERLLPDTADILLTLSPEQIRGIEDKLRRENEKFEAERIRLPQAKRLNEREARYLKNMSSWLGKLTPAQEAEMRAGLAVVPLSDELRLADRRRLQGEFIAALKNPPPRAQFIEKLRGLMFNPEVGRSPAYQASVAQWRRENAALFARVLERATPEQRAHLQRKLRGYASDVIALINAS